MPSDSFQIIRAPVAYVDQLAQRTISDIDLLVVHCTELPDLATARQYAERVLYESGTGNCGHFYIDRDGACWEYVPIERVAHHARGFNPRTIGVELVNLGRFPDWLHSEHQGPTEAYPAAQISALSGFLEYLSARIPSLRWIAGHEDLDSEWVTASDDHTVPVKRKLDPGPLFPWNQLLRRTQLKPYSARMAG